LVGFINVPIIKFSVDWWSTLHQPASVIRLDGPTLHPSMLWPLLVMALGFKLYYVSLLLLRVKSELLAARLRARSLAAVDAA
jgi:heme exporter protein C